MVKRRVKPGRIRASGSPSRRRRRTQKEWKVETLGDIREIRQRTAERVGISVDDLVAQVSPLEALYTVCDHSRALIFLLGDGVVPSNSREGYFARLLVRRGLRALKDLNITYSLADTVSFMIDQIREDYPEFFFNKGDILKLLKVEEARYKETLEKGRATVAKIAADLTAAGKGFDLETLLELYDSHGLNPDVVQEFTNLPIEIPDDFYARVAARHERPVAEPTKRTAISKELPPTKLRVYEDRRRRSFRARVLAVEGEAVVLRLRVSKDLPLAEALNAALMKAGLQPLDPNSPTGAAAIAAAYAKALEAKYGPAPQGIENKALLDATVAAAQAYSARRRSTWPDSTSRTSTP